jgi:hypothetical protein
MQVPHICPRCKDSWIPDNLQPGAFPGAISRADDVTEICSRCGEEEAMQHFEQGQCTPMCDWPSL